MLFPVLFPVQNPVYVLHAGPQLSCELSSGCLLNSMGNLVSDSLVATGSKSKKSCTEASTSVDESVTVRRRNRIGQHGVTF